MVFIAQIVILLVLVGGVVAYIGNLVGKSIGKRRLTLLNLRPRHTAMTITVISGSLIALFTFLIVIAISQDARTAILGLERLKGVVDRKNLEVKAANRALIDLNKELEVKRGQQKELEEKLTTAKKEITALQAARMKLSQEVKTTRQGQLLFKNGDVISISLIQAGPDREKLDDGLRRIIAGADLELMAMGIKTKDGVIAVPPEEFDEALDSLAGKDGGYIVKLIAGRNILWGEKVPASFDFEPNRLIFASGAEIGQRDIPLGLSDEQVQQEIMSLLKTVHLLARSSGIIPDNTGSIGSLPYSQIFELAKKIRAGKKTVTLKVVAKKDIFTVGPLEVDFKTEGK
ncbi:MAG: DUF3084 domain-containing protein [Candidatus Margulisbacteria bacterium]|nr:DUF3084 domain-containing protein [Candidatus Margulisiibacteriota bacterium]MBU1616265.1 DUF3084 domain-containing protein [Candidatus Margulisiibacteriota bacterium]